jgi:hypothetical protein
MVVTSTLRAGRQPRQAIGTTNVAEFASAARAPALPATGTDGLRSRSVGARSLGGG